MPWFGNEGGSNASLSPPWTVSVLACPIPVTSIQLKQLKRLANMLFWYAKLMILCPFCSLKNILISLRTMPTIEIKMTY
jgi:hypothetical protein